MIPGIITISGIITIDIQLRNCSSFSIAPFGHPDMAGYSRYLCFDELTSSLCQHLLMLDCCLCSRAGPNVRLLPVAIGFNIVLWVCTTVSLGFINAGTKTWCDNVQTSLGYVYYFDKSMSLQILKTKQKSCLGEVHLLKLMQTIHSQLQ